MPAAIEDRKQRVSISALWNGTGTAPTGSVVTVSSPGGSVLAIEITGTFTATVQFEGTIDETTWFAITGIPAAGGAGVTSATAAGRWFFQYSGLRAARVRASAYTSGTPVVTMNVGAGGAAGSVAGGAGSSTVVLSPTAALADATANPTIAQIETFPMVWNGTTWDRWKDMAAANGLTTFTGIPAVAPVYLDTTGTPSVRRGVTAASTTGGITGVQVPGSGNLVWDATSFRPQLSDTSGRTQVVGAAADNTTAAGNPVLMAIVDAGGNARTVRGAVTDGLSVSQTMSAGIMAFNGATEDRMRNNVDVTLLASAARTTTQTSADITTYNCQAIVVTLDVTATVSTVSLTVVIRYKDPASGKYIALLTGTTVAATGTTTYCVDPRLTAGTPPYTKTVPGNLGRVIQLEVTVGNANSQTYSLGYSLIPG